MTATRRAGRAWPRLPELWDRFRTHEGEIIPRGFSWDSSAHSRVRGRSVSIMRTAPDRQDACHASEVVLLKFALIHVRDNLLAAGLTVNIRELTKHPVIADRSDLLRGLREGRPPGEVIARTIYNHEQQTVRVETDEEAWLG